MKHIFTLLLIFLSSIINAQVTNEQPFEIVERKEINFDWNLSVGYTDTIEMNITFQTDSGTVTIKKTGISLFYSDGFGEDFYADFTTLHPRVFNIINTVVSNSFKYQNNNNEQLYRKVKFYEKYFGKLEGDMNDDCIQWVPVVKQPEFDPCIEVKN